VLVVGAGPVGCVTARTASECGANVILLKEHQKVGSPVFRVENLSLKCIKNSGLEAKPPIVYQDIPETRIITPNKNYIKFISSKWSQVIINRDLFDLDLSERVRAKH
jgi:flavin-dependent dehydrogenase